MACNPKSKKCPECGGVFALASAASHPVFPFCSERCKLIDLGRWLNGEYAIVEDTRRDNEMQTGAQEIDDPDLRAALDEEL